MPTRILRDWTDSKRVNQISAEAERLFTRLITKADDFGRFHADPRLVMSACFPFGNVSVDHVGAALSELLSAELITIYTVSGTDYLSIYEFRQRTRAMHSRFPACDGQPSDWCPSHVRQNAQVDVKQTVKTEISKMTDTCQTVVRQPTVICRPDSDSDSDSEAHVGDGGACRPNTPTPPPALFSPHENPNPVNGNGHAIKSTTSFPPGFVRFWTIYPQTFRKSARGQCFDFWRKTNCEENTDQICKALQKFKTSRDWTKDGGQFIPAPLVWLRRQAWEAPVSEAAREEKISDGETVWDDRGTLEQDLIIAGLPREEFLKSPAGRKWYNPDGTHRDAENAQ